MHDDEEKLADDNDNVGACSSYDRMHAPLQLYTCISYISVHVGICIIL